MAGDGGEEAISLRTAAAFEPAPMSREAARNLADRLESGDTLVIKSVSELRLIVAALRYYGVPKQPIGWR